MKTESTDMSHGIKQIVKVGFLFTLSADWMGGINYFKNLFTAVSLLDNPKIVPYIYEPVDKYGEILLAYAKVIERPRKKDIKYRLTKIFSLFLGKHFNKDNYLSDYADVDIVSHLVISKKHPSIAWIPDFQHLHLPELFDKNEIKKRNAEFRERAEKSDIVILSSENALEDFKRFAPDCANKGRVLRFVAIPDGDYYAETEKIHDEVFKKYDLPEKYFYIPNQFWKHKNHSVILRAAAILKKKEIDVNLVFTGNTADNRDNGNACFRELTAYAKENGIENNIKMLGTVDLKEVNCLMRYSTALVNPSFFEGWSSSVEEAKTAGKRVILSNIDVHREQNPPGGLYFDPNDAEELAVIFERQLKSGQFGIDSESEAAAKALLPERIKQFGLEYQKIVTEVLNKHYVDSK